MSISNQPDIIFLKKNEISEILETGKKFYTKYGLYFLTNISGDPNIHIAVLIKKSVGKAVERNYYKRIVKEYIRKNIDKFSLWNRIVFIYNYRGKVKFKDIMEEFDSKLRFK
jgi:ribonuclease P protein component